MNEKRNIIARCGIRSRKFNSNIFVFIKFNSFFDCNFSTWNINWKFCRTKVFRQRETHAINRSCIEYFIDFFSLIHKTPKLIPAIWAETHQMRETELIKRRGILFFFFVFLQYFFLHWLLFNKNTICKNRILQKKKIISKIKKISRLAPEEKSMNTRECSFVKCDNAIKR